MSGGDAHLRPPLVLSYALAALLALTAAAALLDPDAYAEETPLWRVQIVVQDQVNLLLLAPVLVAASWSAARGSRGADLVLAGALMYAAYNLVIYAFAVRLNRSFLAYCAALGIGVYALVLQLARLGTHDAQRWVPSAATVRFPAALLVALGVGFGALWLAELIPAALRGTTPPSLAGTGLLTNPVHALDLSVTLPTLVLGGLLLWRRRPWGFRLGAPLLTFALLTDVAIVAIVLASRAAGLPGELGVAVGISIVAVLTAAALGRMLRGLGRPMPAKNEGAARRGT